MLKIEALFGRHNGLEFSILNKTLSSIILGIYVPKYRIEIVCTYKHYIQASKQQIKLLKHSEGKDKLPTKNNVQTNSLIIPMDTRSQCNIQTVK